MKAFIHKLGSTKVVEVANASVEDKLDYYVVRDLDYIYNARVLHKSVYMVSVDL
jgi:hypothetical protein